MPSTEVTLKWNEIWLIWLHIITALLRFHPTSVYYCIIYVTIHNSCRISNKKDKKNSRLIIIKEAPSILRGISINVVHFFTKILEMAVVNISRISNSVVTLFSIFIENWNGVINLKFEGNLFWWKFLFQRNFLQWHLPDRILSQSKE